MSFRTEYQDIKQRLLKREGAEIVGKEESIRVAETYHSHSGCNLVDCERRFDRGSP